MYVGVIHDGVMSPGTKWDTRFFLSFVKTSFCMASKFCRGYAREQDVLYVWGGGRVVAVLVVIW